MKTGKVTCSTVAVGTHGQAGSTVMQNLATQTGGKYYVVRNNKALPRIFQKEARRVARPLVFEKKPGFSPQVASQHQMLQGIDGGFPPITGYVMTTIKKNPLVEVSLMAPLPTGANNAILASWTYGLGKTVCLTTDVGTRWANDWTGWENYEKLFYQITQWSMRPAGDENNFSVATSVDNGKVEVVVTAFDKDDEFINLLNITGARWGPTARPPIFASSRWRRALCWFVRRQTGRQLLHRSQRRQVEHSHRRQRAVLGRISRARNRLVAAHVAGHAQTRRRQDGPID